MIPTVTANTRREGGPVSQPGLQLYAITLDGTMTGSAWGSLMGDDTGDMTIPFEMDFLLPEQTHRHSPWAHYWEGIRDALDAATSSGDLIGGRGDVEEAWLVFRYAGNGESRHVMVPLKPGKATRDFFTAN